MKAHAWWTWAKLSNLKPVKKSLEVYEKSIHEVNAFKWNRRENIGVKVAFEKTNHQVEIKTSFS